MNYETTPDCSGCGGKGRIQISDRPINAVPCVTCLQRYDETHCWICNARLGDEVIELTIRGGQKTRYACGPDCSAVWLARAEVRIVKNAARPPLRK